MLQQQKQQIGKRGGGGRGGILGPRFVGNYREIGGAVNTDLLGLSQPALKKALDACQFELPLDSVESRAANDSSDGPPETSGDTDCDTSEEAVGRKLLRWSAANPQLPIHMNCGEFEMGKNCFDMNNSGQGVDMQNLPSIAEQMERQRTWMTIYFRYRMNWYEAKPVLAKMSREVAYMPANLPLWTRCVKVQLHRKTIFLNAIRAFRNRMQCATSGVRFTMNAFYRETNKKNPNEGRDDPEAKPLPYFKYPDDMPDIKTMVVAQMSVFVSNSTSYFDQFWDESLNENA